MKTKSLIHNFAKTPIGNVVLAADDNSLLLLAFVNQTNIESNILNLEKNYNTNIVISSNDIIKQTKQELEAYFVGKLSKFTIPTQFSGSDFRQQSLNYLMKIPYGQTRNYQEQALAIGGSNMTRAVARANSQNTIAIIIPCHRIIHKNGKLGGYAGGAMRKEFLLSHEKRFCS